MRFLLYKKKKNLIFTIIKEYLKIIKFPVIFLIYLFYLSCEKTIKFLCLLKKRK